jgi:hypothetical protein
MIARNAARVFQKTYALRHRYDLVLAPIPCIQAPARWLSPRRARVSEIRTRAKLTCCRHSCRQALVVAAEIIAMGHYPRDAAVAGVRQIGTPGSTEEPR